MFKIIESFTAENKGKIGVFSGVDRLKIIILHEKGYSERQISDKLKFSKTLIHQAVARLKMFGSLQDLSRTGRPKVTSQRDDHIAKKMVVRLSSTFSKKI